MSFFLPHAPWRFASVLAYLLLTACATSPPMQESGSSSPRYTLAIFPWHISSHREDISYKHGREALDEALKTSDFLPIYTYDRFRQTPEIPLAIRPELAVIWDNVAFPFSVSRTRYVPDHVNDPGPNLEPVYRLGQQLDVDAILMYEMDPQRSFNFTWVYLLDVRQRRTYFDGVSSTQSEGIAKLVKMTKQVFTTYIQDQSTK